jgi:hypothetical protein
MAPLNAKEADRQIRAKCRSIGLNLNKPENAYIIADIDIQGSWDIHHASTLADAEHLARNRPFNPEIPIYIMPADEQHGIMVLKDGKLVPAQ